MSVDLSSDQSASNQGLLMPKLQYRFRVIFENLGVTAPRTELTKQVMDFTRPNVSFADINLDVYNSQVRLLGKHEWQNITCKIRDDATGAVAKLVGEQLQKQLDFMEQSSAAAGIDYKFTTRLEMLDGGNGQFEPTVLETWEIYGCYLQAVDYGSLDYAQSDIATISLTLRFDNALQTPLGTGVGADVGRSIGDSVS